MADRALSTSRRALLGAAASLPILAVSAPVRPERVEGHLPSPDDALWNERLTRYRHLAARAKAAAETGWFRAANDLYYREVADPTADHPAAFTRLTRAEDLYYRRCTGPVQDAAVSLMLTPAPNSEALVTKIAIIEDHHLHEIDDLQSYGLKVLERDLRRISQARAARNLLP
jgi:hypothetical protein